MTQAQKDFLAISHGQEWVTFYESFDKLVQDNLSRSSELLRRAMALPEVADREVQQIRTEMEERLAAERSRQREVLTAFQEDLTGSHRQVSMLARSVGTVIGDLERLSQRVNEAIAAFDAEMETAPAEPDESSTPHGVAAYANGSATSHAAPAGYPTPEAPAQQAEPSGAESEAPVAQFEGLQSSPVDEMPAELNVDDITAAVEEQKAILAAAADELETIESAIDLNALAEAESVPSAPAEQATSEHVEAPAAGESGSSEQRPRPHWLSVARGNGSNK